MLDYIGLYWSILAMLYILKELYDQIIILSPSQMPDQIFKQNKFILIELKQITYSYFIYLYNALA